MLIFFFSFGACNEGKKKVVVTKKDKAPIEYAAKSLVDLNSSDNLKDILCQTWEFKEDVADAVGLDITSTMDVVYRGYSFFNDGTATKDPRGNMLLGSWTAGLNAKPIVISLDYGNGKKESISLAYLSPSKMIIGAANETERKNTELIGKALRNTNLKDDPFYKENVSWRIKPAVSENDDAIKARLKKCIHFFVLFYDKEINSKAEAVSFLGLPSCFKWHAGGIFLQKKEELQEKWINCFYNKSQAMKAYAMAENLLRKKYEWPKTGNWLELNVAVLKQMEKQLD